MHADDVGMVPDLPLGAKLAAGFSLLVALVAIATLLIQANLSSIDRTAVTVAERSVPFDAAISAAAETAKAAANDERGFLLDGDREFAEELPDRNATVTEALASAARLAPSERLREDVREIQAGYTRWAAAVTDEIRRYASDPDGATALALGTNRDLRKAYEGSIATVQEHSAAEVASAFDRLDGDVAGARRTTWLVLAALVLAAAAVGWWLLWVVRGAVRPVLQRLALVRDVEIDGLRQGLAAVAAGDLTHEVQASTPPLTRFTSDQLGAVARAVEEIRACSATSVEAYNRTRTELTRMLGEVTESAGSVSTASEQMATTSDEAGRAVGEIAGAVSEVAQGAERQVQMMAVTRGAAGDTRSVAQDAREVAREGAGASDQAAAAMTSVRESSQQASEAIQALSGKSAQIGGIVETITKIAAQTNLLALNAAIEAARAGDQGRGFAVVADEVRKLAEESQSAAGSIAGLVDEIRSETGVAVSVVEAGARRSADGAAVVEQARQAFSRIADAVDDVARRIDEIVSSADGVSAVAEQSSASAEQVSASTQQTSASTQQIAASAQELAATARGLEALVGRFRLAAEAAPAA